MNRFIAILLSLTLMLGCTACVGPASASGSNHNNTPAAPDHDEQLLHGAQSQLPPGSSISVPEVDNQKDSEISKEQPETPEPSQTPVEPETPPEPAKTDAVPQAPTLRTVDPAKPMVALTFDDGPNATYSDMILDILEQNGAVATFFEVGRNVANCPQPLTRMVELGCEIGTHSNAHKDLSKLSSPALMDDLAAADQAFINAIGSAPTLLRPPYGAVNQAVKHDTGRSVITWTVDTEDWKSRDTDKIVSYVKSLSSLDGEIVLLHSSYESTVNAVNILVPWLIQQGYQLVTVSELMAYYYGELLQPGQFYGYTYFTTHGKTDTPLSLPQEPADPQQPAQQTPAEETPQPAQPEGPAELPTAPPVEEQPADEGLPTPEKPTIPASPDAPIYSTLPAETPDANQVNISG